MLNKKLMVYCGIFQRREGWNSHSK